MSIKSIEHSKTDFSSNIMPSSRSQKERFRVFEEPDSLLAQSCSSQTSKYIVRPKSDVEIIEEYKVMIHNLKAVVAKVLPRHHSSNIIESAQVFVLILASGRANGSKKKERKGRWNNPGAYPTVGKIWTSILFSWNWHYFFSISSRSYSGIASSRTPTRLWFWYLSIKKW